MTVEAMSSCRASSFYLAPGVMRYFRDHTLAAVLPDGTWIEIKHRGDIARLRRKYPTWDGTVLCGSKCTGGLIGLRNKVTAAGSTVEIWNIDERSIEGRRPEDASVHALHKWAITGATKAVGGVRQLVETIAPGAPKSVRNAFEAAILRGEHHAVDVISAAWRAGLLSNPDQIVELLGHARLPVRSVPDPRLERLLRGVVATGRNVDAVGFIASMVDGSQMLDAGARRLLAEDVATPPAILQVLAMDTSESVRACIAENPNTPVSILEHLARGENYVDRLYVTNNPNTPAAILELLSHDEERSIRLHVAKHPNTPAAALEQLAKSSYMDVRLNVAKHPNTPAAALEHLANDGESYVQESVAGHPNTPVAALLRLAQVSYIDARYIVAERSDTPAAVLEQLVQEGDEGMRVRVAKHPNTPVHVLEQLAKSSYMDVRLNVAKHPNTPVHVLEQLAGRSSATVRYQVARNLNTPVAVLEQLAKDEESYVQESVAGNPNTPVSVLEKLATTGGSFVQAYVARNLSTPVRLLEGLSKQDDGMVLGAVAENLNTPVAVLEQLAQEWTEKVRGRVAGNPNTPVHVLKQLAYDEDALVRVISVQHPNTSVSVLENLSYDAHTGVRMEVAAHQATPAGTLEQMARDSHEYVRERVAGNPNTPGAVLEQLAKDEESYVRERVAGNPNTPAAVLEQLAQNAALRDTEGNEEQVRTRRGDDHDDRYEYHAIKNGVPLELHTTADLAYDALVQHGAPAADYPHTITDVRELGRANAPFGFADDTLTLRHTLAESTVNVEDAVLTPRVLSSPRALTENANYMGNCTAGYEHEIRRDETLIIALDDATSAERTTMYNVEIRRGVSDRWDTIGEINSRFNNGVTEAEKRAINTRIAELLHSNLAAG